VNDKPVSKAMLEGEIKRLLTGGAGSVILHIDRSVASEHLVYVAGIATSLNAKVVLATKPGK
jgi:biopolymer transport protein ExbD